MTHFVEAYGWDGTVYTPLDVCERSGFKQWHRLALKMLEKGIIDGHEFLDIVDRLSWFAVKDDSDA